MRGPAVGRLGLCLLVVVFLAARARGAQADGDQGAAPGEKARGGVPTGIPGCPACQPIFDGKSLAGWGQELPNSFVVKDGVIASTGKGSHLWTKDDFQDYRIFFSVRHVLGNHRPTVTFFNARPVPGAAKFVRGLGGIQFQPPHGGSWDYRPGHPGDPKDRPEWVRPVKPEFDNTKWHRCEVLVRGSVGTFRAACCELTGPAPCKATEVLEFKDPTVARASTKGPFSIQIHNAGIFDEYKDLFVDPSPTGDDLISTK